MGEDNSGLTIITYWSLPLKNG